VVDVQLAGVGHDSSGVGACPAAAFHFAVPLVCEFDGYFGLRDQDFLARVLAVVVCVYQVVPVATGCTARGLLPRREREGRRRELARLRLSKPRQPWL
jgi:hypothetical protein